MGRWWWTIVALFSLNALAASVTVMSVAELAVYPQLSAPATVVSLNASRLSVEISARIVEIPVLVGQRVRAGTTLVRLDCRVYELTHDQAQAALSSLTARLALAEYQYQRAESLISKNSISEEVLKQREAEMRALQADRDSQQSILQMAERNVQQCQLRAPFDAIVTARLGQVGELAQPGTPLVALLDAGNLEVVAKVRGEDAAGLTQAEQLSYQAQGVAYPLVLRAVVPVVDSRERTREVRLRFSTEAALPGSAGELIWRHSQPHLPPHLLVRRAGQLGVFTVNSSRAHFVSLPLAAEGRPAMIDLPPDTPVVVDGRHSLQDGDKVSP